MPDLSVDPGNRAIKVYRPNQDPCSYESVLAPVHPGQRVKVNATSAHCQYAQGHESLVGQSWLVGSSAKHCQGSRCTVLEDKALIAPKLILAAIVPPSRARKRPVEIDIETLFTALPDPDFYQGQLAEILVGNHRYSRNGIELSVEIEQVQLLPEGYGAFQYALHHGVFDPDEGLIGLLDLGGGTAIASLWEGDSEILQARIVMDKGGSYGLANLIASDDRMKQLLAGKGKADPARIMDGIARGSYQYGRTSINFKSLFECHRQLWLEGIKNRMAADWQGWFEEIGCIVLVGGAAPLAAHWADAAEDEFVRLCPHPQFANAIGMMPDERGSSGKKVTTLRSA